MGLFRNGLYFSPSAVIEGNSQNKTNLNTAYHESVPKSDCGKIVFRLYVFMCPPFGENSFQDLCYLQTLGGFHLSSLMFSGSLFRVIVSF